MSSHITGLSPGAAGDEDLGRRALAGDREAFGELFARHESGLFNVAYRLTGDREDAADIAQEAFLRVFARLDDLAGRDVNLAAYLHRTARNLVYDRSARRAREAPTGEIERVAGADRAMEADPALSALVGSQGDEVRAANARLPERHRLVLALRELQDMSYEDIGRVLDVTPGAVAQLLARARMALRRELRLEQVDPGAMDPACRSRLAQIGALIDGELDADRARVLTAHIATCAACRAARESFEQARVTYRAWLPLAVVGGLGADTARAAEGRGLVRFGDEAARRAAAAARQGGSGGGGAALLGTRRRRAVAAGAAGVALVLLVGVPTLVAMRSGGGGAPGGEAVPVVTAPSAEPAAAPPASVMAADEPTTTAAPRRAARPPRTVPVAPASPPPAPPRRAAPRSPDAPNAAPPPTTAKTPPAAPPVVSEPPVAVDPPEAPDPTPPDVRDPDPPAGEPEPPDPDPPRPPDPPTRPDLPIRTPTTTGRTPTLVAPPPRPPVPAG
ncbi:MAG: RNA polymerase sigma factor [Thermoleophilia bacterium]